MKLVVDHVEKHSRNYMEGRRPHLFLFDRNRILISSNLLCVVQEWCIEVVQALKSPLSFLQPNVNAIKRAVKLKERNICRCIDTLSVEAFGDLCFRFKVSVANFRAVTVEMDNTSFKGTGMQLMDFTNMDSVEAYLCSLEVNEEQ